MSPDGSSVAPSSEEFERLMEVVMRETNHFGHREHVHLTWLAVRRHGTSRAVEIVSHGIQRTARYAKVPQKYHATISRCWVELVGHHIDAEDIPDFDAFVVRHPALLDKRLIARFYHPATLASSDARVGWVEPDREPFPWQGRARSGHCVDHARTRVADDR